MAKAKIRIADGTPPFTLNVRDTDTNTLLYSTTSNHDEIEIPDVTSDGFNNISYQVTDSLDKGSLKRLDNATLELLEKYHVGPSVANGNFENHIEAVELAALKGCTYTGVVYERSDIEDDAAFTALDSIVFDHTITTGVYLKGFDEVVRRAKQLNIALRVGIHLNRENVSLNDGGTRTLFYGVNALALRPNGELAYKEESGPIPSQMVISYASSELRDYAHRLLIKFMKRYLPAINDGTIMSIGLLTTGTGEAEYPVDYRETNGTKEESSKGDFHPEMVSKFKIRFPEYVSASNSTIANADRTNSDLGRKWAAHLMEEMRIMEWGTIDAVITAIPELTRKKWFQIDVGSATDALAPRRRSYNMMNRLHDAIMLVKVNDLTYSDANHVRFILDHITSVARKKGAVAIIEPTPQNGRFDEAGGNRPYIKLMDDLAKEYGVGISFINNEPDILDWMISSSNLLVGSIPAYKNEFKTISSRKILQRVDYNLSDIMNTDGTSGLQSTFESFKSTQGITRADINIVDNVTPNTGSNNCISGPTLISILNKTASSVQFQFNGVSVTSIAWRIKFGATTVRSGIVNPGNSTPTVNFVALTPATYSFEIEGASCTSGVSTLPLVISGGVDPDPVTVVGTYSTKVGERTYTYNKTPEFDIQFNANGTITDVTPGLNTSGAINTQGGQNVFYMLDYNYHEEEGGVAGKMQSMYLIDNVYTLRKFMMNPVKFPTMASFKANRTSGGYNTEGVNQNNGHLAEILISISSDTKQGNGLAPDWLEITRKLEFVTHSPDQDWTPYNKYLGTTWINRGDSPQAPYQAKGVQPIFNIGDPTLQPNTWLTFKNGQNTIMTVGEAYDIGRHYMTRMGASNRSMYTSEYIENEQGAGVDSYNRVGMNVYRGAMDILRENGHTNVLTSGLFGEYGGDDFYGLLDGSMFYGPRNIWESSLTDNIYKGHGIGGFSVADHDYYTQGHILHRNVNAKYYLNNQKYNFSLEFLALNEKVKLGTKTWGGVDRERSVLIFSTPIIESFTINDQGNKINIEQTRTGEIIPFPNGELLTRLNTQPPVPVGAAFTMGLWATLICAGAISWDAPGANAGQDPTLINWYSDQQVKWRTNGGNFNDYVSGQNGAPITSQLGLANSLWTTATDALVAGRDVIWGVKDRIANLRHVAYTSSRGGYTPIPGENGLHLNGHGIVNFGLFCARDIYDAKKGTALRGDGMVIYINEFLAPNLYEDNVTIAGHNLGRVYGGQTAIGLL
jgi:hypothetical protein